MWVLLLNDMRASNVETQEPVCKAETREELESYLQRETVEPYMDGQWGKHFRQGGPLEWYNPPFGCDNAFINVGTREDWMRRASDEYDRKIGMLPYPVLSEGIVLPVGESEA